ncbi:MAG: glycosyl transferase [Acidobacteria bacterium]|nr:MAG: glycosyl transferase [Acidobacteriota bacterium]PYU75924.1 MAG: glycosyl transferase [Acidobacteriota bacterium]
MHICGLVLFGLIASFWLTHGIRVAYGAVRLPWIKDFAPASDADCPRISILLAARDEEEKLPAALATLMEIDYPDLEVIAVDDRSQDSTGRILERFAAAHPRLRVVHITQLPAGWLGKPHALQKAYAASTGDWLLFTDADVRFKHDALRRAIALVKARNLEHLTLMGDVEMVGFWETVLITFFGMAFHIATDPYRVANPHSRAYVGVGAFQLLKRAAYEASGTHRRLAMEVVDDMKLGKIVKQSGFRSSAGVAQDFVVVRWHAGLGNLVRGVTKNFFAGVGYSVPLVAIAVVALLLMNVAPIFGVFFGQGWTRVFAVAAFVIALCFHTGVDIGMRVSPFYAFTHPLGALLFSYMLLRSTVVTLKQGGIIWRDTFYPLEDLKRGVV